MATLAKNITLKLGLFQFQVDVESAIEDTAKEVSLSNLCTKGGHAPTRIKQTNACPVCKNDDKATFVKGRDVGAGKFVVVPQEEVEKAAGEVDAIKKVIALTAHPAEQLTGAMPGGKTYYLSPGIAAEGAYPVIAALLESRPDLAFVAEYAVRSAPAMYRLQAKGGVLVISQLAYPNQVKQAPSVPTSFNESELAMASQFADMLKMPFDPATYSDKRVEVLAAFIGSQEAVQGTEATPDAAMPTAGNVMDQLAAALTAAQAAQAPAATKPARKSRAKVAAA